MRLLARKLALRGVVNFGCLALLWVQLALGSAAATGRIDSYICQSWQTEDGLPHNWVADIAQTSEGYLWVASRAGLARFDGLSFVPFDLPQTKRRAVSALHTARDGSLWMAVEGLGVFRYQGTHCWHYSTTNGLVSNSVRTLSEGRDGALWMGAAEGLTRWQNGQFQSFTARTGLAADFVQVILEDQDGTVWVGTAGGLNALKNGAVAATYSTREGLPSSSVMSLCQSRNGQLWIGTTGGLAVRHGGAIRPLLTEKNGLPDHFVSALQMDRRGTLWVGTYGGLCRVPEADRASTNTAVLPLCFIELNAERVGFDQVSALLEDREGNLWVGGRDGLSRLRAKVFSRLGKQDGLSNNNTTCVYEDDAGILWAGSWGGGLNRLWEGAVLPEGPPTGFSSDRFLALCGGHDGSLWVGLDHAGGLYRWKDSRLTHYGRREGLTNAPIRVLYEDRHTNLWIGTSRGLSLFKDGHFTHFTPQDGLAGPIVRALLEDAEGTLWIGTSGGLSCRRNGKFSSFTTRDGLSDDFILCLYEDRDRNLWMGTAGGGLNRFKAGVFTAYTTRLGLFSDDVFEILEDDAGYFWMGSPNGVFRVQRQALLECDPRSGGTLQCAHYGKAEGLATLQCNSVGQPAGWKARDGRLWFTTTKGLVVADPEIPVNTLAPPVLLEEVLADRQRVGGVESGRPGAPLPQSTALTLAPGQGELEFRYTALSLAAPEKNRFRYKLEGVDKAWVEAGTRRVATYSHVAPGHYRFQVLAANNDGVWNLQGSEVSLVLQPHFWQCWWFPLAAPLAAIGLVAGTSSWLARRREHRQFERLERQNELERERARIARDIHDDLGSSLTRIAMLSELAEADKANPRLVETHVRKISSSARETVSSLDEIVWAVSPQNDTWSSLVEYLTQYASEFFENTTVRCRLELPLDLPEHPVPAETRHGLFLVLKEALNNVLKHAHASEVRLHVSQDGEAAEIMVVDNGQGFDLEQVLAGNGGNGLKNMRHRVEALQGRFRLESRPGHGTRLSVALTLGAAGEKGGAR